MGQSRISQRPNQNLLHHLVPVALTAILLTCRAAFLQDVMAADAEPVSFEREEGQSLTARCGNQVLWKFHFAQDLPKSFFHPVAVPAGSVLTWNSPPDHSWHHGLWFSWKFINRVNYWEPNNQTGRPDGRTERDRVDIDTAVDGSAKIHMLLKYRTGEAEPVLTEDRTITVSAPGKDGSYHFDWQCVFTARDEEIVLDRTPLPHEPGGKVYGGYAGLSVRFAKELTQRAATTHKGPVEFSPQSRYRGEAIVMDYAGEIAGNEVGIAICDHPKNPNHPSPWYAIRSNVMSYYSPAVICNAPYTLRPRESFTLRYRVIIHNGKWDADRLVREYDRFVSQSSPKHE